MDIEHLIGKMIGSAVGGGGFSGGGRKWKKKHGGSPLNPAAAMFRGGGMGKLLIGAGLGAAALAAYNHYQSKQQGGSPAGPANVPAAGGWTPPPPPAQSSAPGAAPAVHGVAASAPAPAHRAVPPPLPPVPGVTNLTVAPAAPPVAATPASGTMPPIAMLRAMIAAANADHDIDAEERQSILEAASEIGLTHEERALIESELARPLTIAALAAEARTPDDARNLYTAALLIMEVDTDEERAWLRKLAERLRLAPEVTAAIHADLGHQAP